MMRLDVLNMNERLYISFKKPFDSIKYICDIEALDLVQIS